MERERMKNSTYVVFLVTHPGKDDTVILAVIISS